ncbi:MAG: hypothetical protein GX213_15295 [Clostridiaceae bacterium]|nr:hypothetical protein [Clostridiaceae bacterium]
MLNIGIREDFPVSCEIMETYISQYVEKHGNVFCSFRFVSEKKHKKHIDMHILKGRRHDFLFPEHYMVKLIGIRKANKIPVMELNRFRPGIF